MRFFDPYRWDVFCTILSRPDPLDLPARTCRQPLPGDVDRFRRWVPRLLRAQRERMVEGRAWANDLTDEVREMIQEVALE